LKKNHVFFFLPDSKSHMTYCHHFASFVIIIVIVDVHILIFFFETTGQNWTKLGRNVHWMFLYKIYAFFFKGVRILKS
jgi:hypothetical protein